MSMHLPSHNRTGLVATFFAMIAMVMTLSAPAQAANPAEAFVQANVQKGLTILNDKTAPRAQVSKAFREFLLGLTDMDRIALFTLGAAKRTASDADKQAFTEAFKDYATAIYESRLTQYSGQSLKVTGSTQRAKGDWIVKTALVDPSGSSSGQDPIEVDFRVMNDKGKMVVIDASVAGVWLGIEERDQFSAFLSQHNNSVPALTEHLKELAQQIRNGAPTPKSGG